MSEQPKSPIVSNLARDPDMVELIAMFVEEMPRKVRAFEQCFDSGDMTELRRLAHQLKGAGGGYGFPDLSTTAGALEQALLRISPTVPENELNQVRERVDELVDLCRRVSVG